MFAARFYGARFYGPSYWGKGSVALVEVPNVANEAQGDGTTTLEGAGFVVAVATEYSSTVPAGFIIRQEPAGGEFALPGSTVTITVSLGEAPVQDTQPTGGWWPDYEMVRRAREKRRREIEEAEEETQRLQDETDREIARLLRIQEAKDAEREDLERLQKLADRYAATAQVADLPKPVRVAILNANDQRTRNSLEQMQRVIEQADFDEMLAIQLQLLMIDGQ